MSTVVVFPIDSRATVLDHARFCYPIVLKDLRESSALHGARHIDCDTCSAAGRSLFGGEHRGVGAAV